MRSDSATAAFRIQLCLREAQALLHGSEVPQWARALHLGREVLDLLGREGDAACARLRAGAWRVVGLSLAASRRAEHHVEAVGALDQALRWMGELRGRLESVERREERSICADLWMQRGLVWLRVGSEAALDEALRSFDEAIRCRDEKPAADDAWGWHAWLGGWINRADALTRRRKGNDLSDAMEAHAIIREHLSFISHSSHPELRGRCAVAWLHCGLTLRARARADEREFALHCFEQTIALCESPPAEGSAILEAARCSGRVNRAGMRLQDDPAQATWVGIEAATVRDLWSRCGPGEAIPDEIGMAAAVLECQAAICLARADDGPGSGPACREWAASTTEVAIQSLRTLASRSGASAPECRSMVVRLLRDAATLAVDAHPTLLVRLVREGVVGHPWSDDETIRTEIAAAWRALLGRVQQGAFSSFNTPRFDDVLESLGVLEELRDWLRTGFRG